MSETTTATGAATGTTAPATRSKKPSTGGLAEQRKRQKEAVLEQTANQLRQSDLLGEIVTWKPGGHKTIREVTDALTVAGFDAAKFAKNFKPSTAFTRACKALEKNQDINIVRGDGDEIVFQFNERIRSNDGDVEEAIRSRIKYGKDVFVRLDLSTGQVRCKKVPELEKEAQKLLDQAMTRRTPSDITSIVQRLFDEADIEMPPIRDQGGAYLVFAEHGSYADKVQQFVETMGGRLRRFPVPAGTAHGDDAVKETYYEYLQRDISALDGEVTEFNVNTRDKTLDEKAKRIKELRIRIEGRARHLGDLSVKALEAVEFLNQKLAKRIEQITKERETAVTVDGVGEMDDLGSRRGSNNAMFNACIPDHDQAALSMSDIAKKAEVPGTYYNHLAKLLELKRVTRTPDNKYRRAIPAAVAAATETTATPTPEETPPKTPTPAVEEEQPKAKEEPPKVEDGKSKKKRKGKHTAAA